MDIQGNLRRMFSLEGKVILLTGAAGGIGRILAEGMAGVGGRMALTDIDAQGLEVAVKSIQSDGGEARGYPADITDLEAIKSIVAGAAADFGRIDVLINCAGVNKRDGFLDVTEAGYDRIMNINLKSIYFLSQEAAKVMRLQGGGNIINMASHNSVGMLGGCSVYGATKSAVTALTRSMAVEWAQYGIRANALAPGHIKTALTAVTWENPIRSQYLRDRIAMERPGTPEEILGPAVMLASDASSYMSGMMVHIDGGCLAGGKPWAYDTRYEPLAGPARND